MSKELLLLNVLNALEELSYYESKSVSELTPMFYKDLTYYFTENNRQLANEVIKELQKE